MRLYLQGSRPPESRIKIHKTQSNETGCCLTHKNLAGLLGKLVKSLALHLEDLHIEGEQVLPEHWDEALERYLYSPLHSFLSGHGTNQKSGIHILESLRSCQMASKTEYVTFAGQRSNQYLKIHILRFFTTLKATLGSSVATTSLDM